MIMAAKYTSKEIRILLLIQRSLFERIKMNEFVGFGLFFESYFVWIRQSKSVLIKLYNTMFKKVNQQQLLRKNVKDVNSGSLNKLRILESIPLKKLNDSQSSHSSVMTSSIHSSVKNLPNVSLSNSSVISSQFSLRNSLIKNRSKQKFLPSPQKKLLSKQQTIQQLLQRHFNRPFTKSLVQFLNKDWSSMQKQYLSEKKLQNFVQVVIQRGSWLRDLIDEFLQKQYQGMNGEDRRSMSSVLFRQSTKSFKDLETIIPQIIKKIPEERILIQQTLLQELSKKLLDIYDPKFAYSNSKMKERINLYHEQFVSKRNSLKSQINQKLKPNLHFIQQAQIYFTAYQKQILKLKAQLAAVQNEKSRYQQMLSRKSNFTPLQVDYDKLYDMRQKAQQEMKHDLQINIIQFHEEKHKKNQKNIAMLQQNYAKTKIQNQRLTDEIAQLREHISDWKRNQPQKIDQGIQVFLIAQGKGSQSLLKAADITTQFLQNVVTPFSFSKDIAANLLNLLTIDKILYDYELVRQKLALVPFQQFVLQWFVIRTGCKKVAQIFTKNFQYSLKELKTTHKRFWLFQKLCGWNGFRFRNMQQDLEGIFFNTHLCWYYLVKLTLLYRKKLSESPNGYHIMPPLPCQDIFKLPLRKIYELVEDFLTSEDIQIPQDLTQKIDHYCINEISKYKANDEQFQKQTLQQIHILRQINFDLIASFVLEYIANLKCSVVEKLLRTIQNKQRQDGTVLAYTQFQVIYRRFYKERRAKIQLVFSKLCLINQHDMLNVENVEPVAKTILEDQSNLRSAFQKLQSLKVLVISQKTALMKGDKKILNPNSYQNFRQRFYQQFYDFYSTTSFLEQIFKIVKSLIKKRLFKSKKGQSQVARLTEPKIGTTQAELNRRKSSISKKMSEGDDSISQEGSQVSDLVSSKNKATEQVENDESKDFFTSKLQEWGKIISRVPHFATHVLTIDQIIIHNMRRKEMIQVSEFAWKTLREILSILGKQ